MKIQEHSSPAQIPNTGRIGRLVKLLQLEIERDAFIEILENAEKYESMNAAEKSDWWKNVVSKMERRLGQDKAVQIMRKCGSKCCGSGQRATARRLYTESATMQGFLDKISTHDVREGNLTYRLEDDKTIIAEHHKCFCKQVAYTKERFENTTYCQCSVEFNKQFFAAALGKEVQAELLQSIICGAKSCKFRITL
jgi:predicted ArsR family transcriptional regulator